jgi:hypothetical protein
MTCSIRSLSRYPAGFTDDVEYFVTERAAHVLHFSQKRCEHMTFARVGRDKAVDVNVARLPDAVDSTHPLFEAVWVPRDVVVHHQMTELEVDSLTGGLGGDHDLCALTKLAFGGDAFAQLHAAVDDGDIEVGSQLFDEEVEGVFVFGEDQQFGGLVIAKSLVLHHVEQFVELDFGTELLGLLGLHKQGAQCSEFIFQFGDRGG